MAKTIRCAAARCRSQIPTSKLYCLDHWKRIPKAVQDEIYAAYRAKDRIKTLELVRDISFDEETQH